MGLATYLGLRSIHWQHPMDGVEAKNRKTIAFYREQKKKKKRRTANHQQRKLWRVRIKLSTTTLQSTILKLTFQLFLGVSLLRLSTLSFHPSVEGSGADPADLAANGKTGHKFLMNQKEIQFPL